MKDENLLSEAARKIIADKLRFTAEKIEKGQITPDSFDFDAEWVEEVPHRTGYKRKKPSGRVFLNLAYWTTPIEALPE